MVLSASPGRLKELAQYTTTDVVGAGAGESGPSRGVGTVTRRRNHHEEASQRLRGVSADSWAQVPTPRRQRSYVSMNAMGRLALNSRRKMSVRA
jgi:hypothetical protein